MVYLLLLFLIIHSIYFLHFVILFYNFEDLKNDLLELSKQPDVISVISSLKSKFSPLEGIRDKATRVEVEDALDNVLIEDINKIKIYLIDIMIL